MSVREIGVLLALNGRIDPDAAQQVVQEQDGLVLAGVIDNDVDWAARSSFDAEALVIACETPTDHVLDLIEQENASRRSQHPIVVVCTKPPNGDLRRVFEAGADDIVVTDDLASAGPQLRFAIDKAITRRATPAAGGAGPTAQLICVLGPKGGTGKTLTASNLTTALAMNGARVALVDLDLQFGDLGLVMGLSPDRSIFDLVVSGGSLDAEKLYGFLTPHPSGAQVLLAPVRPDQASAVTPDFLRELYAVLRTEFDFIVVDTPPGFTAEVIATIDAATTVCLIGTLDAPSLKNAKLAAETLELMGYARDRVRLVLNRADSNVGVSHADVVTILGRAPDVLVPSTREIVRSVNAGTPIVMSSPRSEGAKSFQALAHMFLQATEGRPAAAAVPARRRGLKLARS